MPVVVKVVDSVVVEMYGTKVSGVELNSPITHPGYALDGEHYFLMVSDVISSTPILTDITKDDFEHRANREAWPRQVDLSGGKIWFRFHRGLLADAMTTAVEVKDKESLLELITKTMGDYISPKFRMKIKKYGPKIDTRIGWDTHMVTCNGIPVGFLSGDLK